MKVEYHWSSLATVGVFAFCLILVAVSGAPYLVLGLFGAIFLAVSGHADILGRRPAIGNANRKFLRSAVPLAAACLSSVAFATTYDPTPVVTWRVAGLIGVALPLAVHLLLSRSRDAMENRAMLFTMAYCIGVWLAFSKVVPFGSTDHLLPALAICFFAVLLPAAVVRHVVVEGLRHRPLVR
jgi:hypothetical protein